MEAARRWVGPLLAAATVAAYAPVVGFGFVDVDDPLHVTANPRVLDGLSREGIAWAFSELHAGYWIPLTWLSHMLDVEWFGLHAGAHHATNLLLHAVNAGLVFALLERLTGRVGPSAFAAALFALHPLRVESVAWVTERKDVLSALFGLLSLWVYAGTARRPGAPRLAACTVLLALSLMAKPMLVTLPGLMLLLDAWPLRRLRDARGVGRAIAEKLPLIAVSVGFGALALVSQRGAVRASELGPLELGEIPLPLRLANAAVSCVRYLGRTLWPTDLAVLYPHPYLPGGEPWAAWQIAGSALLLIGLTLAGVAAARSRPGSQPYWIVGWLWFLGGLVPVIGVVQVGAQAMADRFTYVPSIGLALALAWGTADALADRVPPRWRAALGALVLAALVGATQAQLRHWRDTDALYRRALSAAPGNPLVHVYYAAWLAREGRTPEALTQYRAAARFGDYAPVAHFNLGYLRERRGQPGAALAHYREAVRLAPDFGEAHQRLGRALVALGRRDEARPHLVRARRLLRGR